MKIPALTGIIRRRILLNYRVAPPVAQALLPIGFLPKLVGGYAIAGIWMIRLESIRPKGVPSLVGMTSENCAHRIAVTWEADDGGTREGVFVPRRDTGSRLNAFAGGRFFPGVHHLSSFAAEDRDGHISLRVVAADMPAPLVSLEARETDRLPGGSVFTSLAESSRFFEAGSIGYSSRPRSDTLDGLRLSVPHWKVSPLGVQRVESAFFDDPSVFPSGSIDFDHALIMRDAPHEWRSQPTLSRPLPGSIPPSAGEARPIVGAEQAAAGIGEAAG